MSLTENIIEIIFKHLNEVHNSPICGAGPQPSIIVKMLVRVGHRFEWHLHRASLH